MPNYPEPEGPEEVPSEVLASGLRVELLLRNPESWTGEDRETMIVPNPRWLEWAAVPLIANPSECYHCYTVCAECADSWGQDYFMRIFQGDANLVWISPDHPDAGDNPPENPPLYHL